jgi:hypothetical protein
MLWLTLLEAAGAILVLSIATSLAIVVIAATIRTLRGR